MAPVDAPQPLAPEHDLSQFSSGEPAVDGWLRRFALRNETRGGARTYVACDGARVAGFYSLAASAVERRRVPSFLRASSPQAARSISPPDLPRRAQAQPQ